MPKQQKRWIELVEYMRKTPIVRLNIQQRNLGNSLERTRKHEVKTRRSVQKVTVEGNATTR